VARLEALVDEGDDELDLDDVDATQDTAPRLPDAFDDGGEPLEDADPDALVQEVEQFLRDRNDDR
jgi:hypothetical protein